MTTSIFRPYGGGSKPALISEGYPVMTNLTIEKIAKTNADALTKSGQAAETIMKGRTEALTESGNASRTAVQELAKAYQELATKNARNLTAAIQALSAVKSQMQFRSRRRRRPRRSRSGASKEVVLGWAEAAFIASGSKCRTTAPTHGRTNQRCRDTSKNPCEAGRRRRVDLTRSSRRRE